MKSAAMLAVALAAFSMGTHAAGAYDSYEAFYANQPGAVFGHSIKYNAGKVYSYSGEPGVHVERRATLGGQAIRVDLAPDRITINDKTYRFARATTFLGEHASDIYPVDAEVFLAARTNGHPSVLCVEGSSNGSGESDRYKQIYLLLNPLPPQDNATFLHLPSLLSSCRAVLTMKDGKLVFPKNSYLLDDAQESRVGLLVSYYSYENQRFVPASYEIRLRFTHPEIPFQFSVQNKN